MGTLTQEATYSPETMEIIELLQSLPEDERIKIIRECILPSLPPEMTDDFEYMITLPPQEQETFYQKVRMRLQKAA